MFFFSDYGRNFIYDVSLSLSYAVNINYRHLPVFSNVIGQTFALLPLQLSYSIFFCLFISAFLYFVICVDSGKDCKVKGRGLDSRGKKKGKGKNMATVGGRSSRTRSLN